MGGRRIQLLGFRIEVPGYNLETYIGSRDDDDGGNLIKAA